MHGIILAAAVSLLPPAEYDHAPKQPPRVFYTDQARIVRMCRQQAVACTIVLANGVCIILMPKSGPARHPAVYRHEVAHCNGWRH